MKFIEDMNKYWSSKAIWPSRPPRDPFDFSLHHVIRVIQPRPGQHGAEAVRGHLSEQGLEAFSGHLLEGVGQNLHETAIVSAATPFVTPGLDGTPKVASPEPTSTSRLSL